MNRRIDQLSQVLHEMQDRYGPADPLVTQLQEAIVQVEGVASTATPSMLRNSPHAFQRRDVLIDCKRVMQRASNYWN